MSEKSKDSHSASAGQTNASAPSDSPMTEQPMRLTELFALIFVLLLFSFLMTIALYDLLTTGLYR